MTLFSLIDQTQVRLAPGQRLIKRDAYQKILDIQEVMKKTLEECEALHQKAIEEIKQAREEAQQTGFQEGLERWAQELAKVHDEVAKARVEFEQVILSTAILAAQKFVSRELKLDPDTMVDIVKTQLKAVAQHKRITLYCSAKDFEVLEKGKPELKALFEQLEVLGIYPKESLQPGAYIIETERGIINHSDVNCVWQALQKALEQALKALPASEAAPTEEQSQSADEQSKE